MRTVPRFLRLLGSSGRRWGTTLAAVTIAFATNAHACAVCWGNPDDPLVKGANSGIWVLLGVVAFVQAGFIAMFWGFWRRAREQRRFRESFRVIHPFDRVDSIPGGGPQS